MSLKDLHVGGWYRCRDERTLGHVVGRVLNENTYPFAVVLYRDGKYFDVVALTHGGWLTEPDKHDFDLVEHLPDCTGPNWNQKKWRKATPEDAKKGSRCRVLGNETFLLGYLWLQGNVSFAAKGENGLNHWHPEHHVEVLDD